VIWKKLD